MFEFLNESLKKRKLDLPLNNNNTKRFDVNSLGTFLTDDFNPIASNFEDYSTDNLIAAGVDMNSSNEFTDNSLDVLDNVEDASHVILDREDFNIHNQKKESEK